MLFFFKMVVVFSKKASIFRFLFYNSWDIKGKPAWLCGLESGPSVLGSASSSVIELVWWVKLSRDWEKFCKPLQLQTCQAEGFCVCVAFRGDSFLLIIAWSHKGAPREAPNLSSARLLLSVVLRMNQASRPQKNKNSEPHGPSVICHQTQFTQARLIPI